jgi:hypothetical protein
MRTTIHLADDVTAAIEALRRETGAGVSEAINLLIRRGLATGQVHRSYEPRSHPIGVKVDVSNVAEALEQLDGPAAA